jgi:hypothetical protein
MSRVIVEYNPPLSMLAQKIIRDEVSPSMISNDDMSSQYDISMVSECLYDIFYQGLEEVEFKADLELITNLIDEGVHYIEF